MFLSVPVQWLPIYSTFLEKKKLSLNVSSLTKAQVTEAEGDWFSNNNMRCRMESLGFQFHCQTYPTSELVACGWLLIWKRTINFDTRMVTRTHNGIHSLKQGEAELDFYMEENELMNLSLTCLRTYVRTTNRIRMKFYSVNALTFTQVQVSHSNFPMRIWPEWVHF